VVCGGGAACGMGFFCVWLLCVCVCELERERANNPGLETTVV
jgi:hypothetical protein